MSRQKTTFPDYLHRCGELHIRVTKARYGKVWDLRSIEDAAKDIRSRGQLTYDDIEMIRAENVWNANVFGYWPPQSDVEPDLKSINFGIGNLRKKEKTVISSLLRVFRQIEPVSVILRFISPEDFGILSPPVEKVLGLGPLRNHTDRYRAYLRSLRKIKDDKDRGFDTVADVDMALWVLQVGVLDEYLLKEGFSDIDHEDLKDGFSKSEHEKLLDGFDRDSKLREVRVANLTKQLFDDLTREQLAEALLPTDHVLAGQIAGIKFEQHVRKLTYAKPEDSLKKLVYLGLPAVIRRHYSNDPKSQEVTKECQMAHKIRNQAIHLDPKPGKKEARRLIDAMKVVERMGESKSQQ